MSQQTALEEVRQMEQQTEELYSLWAELRRVLRVVRDRLGKDHPLAVQIAAATSSGPAEVPDIHELRRAWSELGTIPEAVWQQIWPGWPSFIEHLGSPRRQYGNFPSFADLERGSDDDEAGHFLAIFGPRADDIGLHTMRVLADEQAVLLIPFGAPRERTLNQVEELVNRLRQFYDREAPKD